MNVDDTGSTVFNTETLTRTTLTGLGMGAAGITYSGLAVLNLSLGSGGNDLYVSSTQTGTITNINLQRTNAPVQIITITGVDFVNIGTLAPASGGIVNGVQAPVTVVGDGSDILNVDDTGSAGAKTGTVTNNTLTGLGMGLSAGITYGGQASLNISLGSGANTLNVLSTYFATTTTLKDGLGNDIVNIQSTSGPTNIVTQSGGDVINIGSLAPVTGGILNDIQGAVTVVGDGHDTLNLDDTGTDGQTNGTLSSTALTGFGMGLSGITYSGLALLNVSLGSGPNNLTVSSTQPTTTTNINVQSTNGPTNITTLSGIDIINIGSLAPTTGGILDNIQGSVTVVGDGSDIMNVDDTGSTKAKYGVLTNNRLYGLNMGAPGITYGGLAALNISLGAGANAFDIVSTQSATTTTLKDGTGSNTVYVQSTSGPTNILTQSGSDVIDVGTYGTPWPPSWPSQWPQPPSPSLPSGVVNGIQGALTVVGNGSDVMYVDDIGSNLANAGTLGSNTLTGLGIGPGGITYSGLALLNVFLGNGGNTFTVSSTNSGTSTDIDLQAATAATTITTVSAAIPSTSAHCGPPAVET